MSTVDYFEIAEKKKKKHQEDQEEAKSRGGGNFKTEYQEVEYLGMELDNPKAFRILGIPAELEDKRNQYDPKIVLTSQIVTDNGKDFKKVIWPHVYSKKRGKYVPDPNWIFTRLMDKVQESDWKDYDASDEGKQDENGDMVVRNADGKLVNERTDRTGRFIRLHKDTKSYKMFEKNFIISKNGKKINMKYYPSVRIVMNVIDRMDDYCKTRKRTKVLTNNVTYYEFTDDNGVEKRIPYADVGISKTAYDKIFYHCKKYIGDWSIDLVVSKTKSNNMYDWEILDASDAKKLPEHIRDLVSEEPLTDEEEKYEMVNLDDSPFRISSASYLKKHFEERFRSADLEFGTNFLQELNQLCDKELEELKKKNVNQSDTNVEDEDLGRQEEDAINEPESEFKDRKFEDGLPIKEKSSERRSRKQSEEKAGSDPQNYSDLPYWDKLDGEDKKDIETFGTGLVDGIIQYNESVTVVPCDSCKKNLPDTVLNCPYCGKEFKAG